MARKAVQRPEADGAGKGFGGTEHKKKRLTINDIARLSKVSKKTVSRVINGSPNVREETRLQVASIIDQFGYEPDPQARGLALNRSFLIGLVYDNPNAQYIVNIQGGMLEGLRGTGFELVVHPCLQASPSFLSDVRNFVERQKLFGVVLLPPVSENEVLVQMLRNIECLYVRIAALALDTPETMIVARDRVGVAEAAEYLIAQGHQRIGYITGPADYRSTLERKVGFAAALARHGVALDPNLVVEGAYSFESGVSCGAVLCKRDPRPTAIFATNDEMAAGVYYAASTLGLQIPRDISVVGFDDSPIATRIWPPLTTVRQPIKDMGRMAAERLMAHRREGVRLEPLEIVPNLVVRGSVAKLN